MPGATLADTEQQAVGIVVTSILAFIPTNWLPVLNPLITLLTITPYRKAALRAFAREGGSVTTTIAAFAKTDTNNNSKNGHGRSGGRSGSQVFALTNLPPSNNNLLLLQQQQEQEQKVVVRKSASWYAQ
jgi:hypothetical protein